MTLAPRVPRSVASRLAVLALALALALGVAAPAAGAGTATGFAAEHGPTLAFAFTQTVSKASPKL